MPIAAARRLKVVLALALVSSLAACAGLSTLRNVTQPTDLYDLTPKSTYADDLPSISAQVVVEEPTAVASVNTDRIAIKPNPYQVQYFPDARWVDRAPVLVQSLLIESFENTGKVAAVGRQAIGLSPDFTLVVELREFQAAEEGGADAPITVLVQLNIKIVKEPRGVIIASQSFAHLSTSDSAEMIAVITAFDEALGKTMGRAVDWAVRRIAAFSS